MATLYSIKKQFGIKEIKVNNSEKMAEKIFGPKHRDIGLSALVGYEMNYPGTNFLAQDLYVDKTKLSNFILKEKKWLSFKKKNFTNSRYNY